MLRLALELCAGRGQVLESTPVAATGKGFHLEMRADAAVASLERIERYVASASRALDAPFTMTRHVVELTDEAPPPCEPRAADVGVGAPIAFPSVLARPGTVPHQFRPPPP